MHIVNPDDLVEPSAEASKSILLLMRSWPFYELALTEWLSVETGMQPDIARIMIGNMDTRNKLDKLVELHKHRNLTKQSQTVELIKKGDRNHSKTRNTVVHCPLMGAHKSNPETLSFLTSKFVKGRPDVVKANRVKLGSILAAAQFANAVSDQILASVEKARRAQSGEDTLDIHFPSLPQ